MPDQRNPSGRPPVRSSAGPNAARELLDLLQVRSLLEPQVAALAATRASDAQIAAIEQALESLTRCAIPSMDAAGAVRAYHSADAALHQAIADASGNLIAARLVRACWPTPPSPVAWPLDDDSDSEHRAIVAAIRAGRPEVAHDQMWAHLASTLARATQLLEAARTC